MATGRQFELHLSVFVLILVFNVCYLLFRNDSWQNGYSSFVSSLSGNAKPEMVKLHIYDQSSEVATSLFQRRNMSIAQYSQEQKINENDNANAHNLIKVYLFLSLVCPLFSSWGWFATSIEPIMVVRMCTERWGPTGGLCLR